MEKTMKTTMKTTMRKIVAVLLAMLMLVSVGSVAAFAKTTGSSVKRYNTVVSFGDSVASGVSMSNFAEAHKTAEAKKTFFVRVPGSYVDIVANKVKAKKLYPLSQPGMRSEELRMLLCNDYQGDRYEDFVANMLIGMLSPGGKYKGKTPLKDYKKFRKQYQNAVKEADLVLISIGFNDMWLSILAAAMELQESGKLSDNPLDTLFKEAEKLGSLGDAIKKAEEAMNTVLGIAALVPVLLEAATEASARYYINQRAIIERIYQLNPDVTICAVGYHEAMIPGEFDPSNFMHYLAVTQIDFEIRNLMLMVRPTLYGTYYYADTHGTETVLSSTDTWDPHPTDKGQKNMAKKILKALPKA